MYNVLAKLRSGEALTDKDRRVHEQGLVSVLRQVHDDLDAAVADAYGWPADLSDDELLRRLVALNAERAAEERRGLVRWLRPEFQNPSGAGGAAQGELELKPDDAAAKAAKSKPAVNKPAWPASLAEQARSVRAALQARPDPAAATDLAAAFKGGRNREAQVAALLDTLVTLGQARRTPDGRFVA